MYISDKVYIVGSMKFINLSTVKIFYCTHPNTGKLRTYLKAKKK